MSSDNGKENHQPPTPSLQPEDIAYTVTVIVTKTGQTALLGDIDNLPVVLGLLGEGVAIASKLVEQALPKRIVLAEDLPPEFRRKG